MEEAKHLEITGQNAALKEGYAADCQEAFAKAKDGLNEIWSKITKADEEQRLMDSIYESVTSKAVATVKEYFREYGINIVHTERYGIGRVGIGGLHALPRERLTEVVNAMHPMLSDIRESPDLNTITMEQAT